MLKITSNWEIQCLKPYITVNGTADNTSTTVDGDGLVTISLSECSSIGVPPDAAYEAIENMAQDVDTLMKVWGVENAIAADLMHMVDISPVGYNKGEWQPECNEKGLSWHLDLKPSDYTSIVVSVYLYADLNPEEAEGRVLPDVNRVIGIEVRVGLNYVATLYSIPVPKKRGPITMDMVREYLQGDHLNIQLLCDYMGMKLTPTS